MHKKSFIHGKPNYILNGASYVTKFTTGLYKTYVKLKQFQFYGIAKFAYYVGTHYVLC